MSTLKTKVVSAPINGATVESLALQTNNVDRVTVDPAGNVLVAGDLTVAGSLFGAVPAGTVIHVAMNTAPSGYLKANGAAVSRTTYAALFAAIGTTFGVGNGSTTFNLPDLRGEFIRGWDDGRSIDTGRAFGSSQLDQLQGHQHSRQGFGYGSSATTANGGGSGAATVVSGPPNTVDGANGTPRTGPETRPRNVALLACIKF